ncbi:MAG: thioredoxin domain-containing protein, partial [Caldilineaceae bacterium]|nr:thioredoxin domain-containing protein [Caldilineaceae bacterium]
GKFFVWSPAEIETLLGAENARLFNAHFGVSPRGNFEGHNILNINMTLADVARRFGKTEQAVAAVTAEGKHALFAARELRIKPARDEKVLTEWNGLMIHALADCGAVLGRADALDAARKAANFVLDKMSQPDGKLYRSWTPPQPSP